MNRPLEPTGSINRPRFRLDTGIDVLETWTESATQSEKNAVYKALFAMTDRSLFRNYRVVDDFLRLSEFFILVRDDLVIKICVHCFDSFGIVYIGPREGAPGLVRGGHDTDLAA